MSQGNNIREGRAKDAQGVLNNHILQIYQTLLHTSTMMKRESHV
jgi:hypothetical protein